MLLKDFRILFNQKLANVYPQTEIDSFFFLLIEKELKLQRIDLALNTSIKLDSNQLSYFEQVVDQLQKQEPIQYILGETEFYGLTFKVTNDTLIPRPETEELVDWILNDVQDKSKLTILDIGTGSGCIPITLAKNLPNAIVYSIDVSKNALAIAKQNATSNKVNIHFIEQDILSVKNLEDIITSQKFDIIVSNPPYVRELEKKEIQANVLNNEPHLALFVTNDNPLIFYSKIADLAKNNLTESGALYFEINQYLGKETIEMLSKKGFTNELRKDLFNNDRMTKSTI